MSAWPPHPGPGLMKRAEAGGRGVCGATRSLWRSRRAGWRQPPDQTAARQSPGADAARLACVRVGGESTVPDWRLARTHSTGIQEPFHQAPPALSPVTDPLAERTPLAGERGPEVVSHRRWRRTHGGGPFGHACSQRGTAATPVIFRTPDSADLAGGCCRRRAARPRLVEPRDGLRIKSVRIGEIGG